MHPPAGRSISIIMPAYNEEATIEWSVRSVLEKLNEYRFDYEIFIFDDASTDQTGKIADQLAAEYPNIMVFHNSKNMNLGFNFARGIKLASKTYAGLLPCHGLTAEKSFDSILPALEKAEVVVAYIANPEVRSFRRRVISWFNVKILNLFFGYGLRYYHMNFYQTELLKKLPTSTNSYALMVELLVYAIHSGASFIEVPFFHRKRLAGRSKAMRPKNIVNILKTYGRILWRIKILREKIG